MKKFVFYILLFYLFFIFEGIAKENFYKEAKNKFDKKKMEDSKFLFQRNIVFYPRDAKSYLYLAKIYNFEKNEIEELKNLKTTLLLDPQNEEAMYMLIDIELEKSNFSEVKNLTKKFNVICSTFCEKTESINKRLENIEAKNETK